MSSNIAPVNTVVADEQPYDFNVAYDSMLLKLRSLMDEVRELKKNTLKLNKDNAKLTKSSTKRQRKPFNKKALLLSEELSTFFGLGMNAALPRSAVAKLIHSYINVNNLKDDKNRSLYLNSRPGGKALYDLLQPTDSNGEQCNLTFHNLQAFINRHLHDGSGSVVNDEDTERTTQTVTEYFVSCSLGRETSNVTVTVVDEPVPPVIVTAVETPLCDGGRLDVHKVKKPKKEKSTKRANAATVADV